jgi:hypothetical protein
MSFIVPNKPRTSKIWLPKLGVHLSATAMAITRTMITGTFSTHLADESLMFYPRNKSVNSRTGRPISFVTNVPALIRTIEEARPV